MPSFYNNVQNNTYKNTFYALNIALDDYLSSKFLENDSSRIIYSSTDYALVKRSGKENWNNANLPFINYRLSGKLNETKRPWFNYSNYSQGVYIPELRRKIRLSPSTIEYDCSYWTSRDDDFQYASDMLLIDADAETKLRFFLEYNDIQVANIAIVDFQIDASPKFTESDWLEKNNILSMGMNMSIQTFIPIDNVEGFCIPKKILMDFLVKKDVLGKDDVIEYEEAMEFVIDHFNQKITI